MNLLLHERQPVPLCPNGFNIQGRPDEAEGCVREVRDKFARAKELGQCELLFGKAGYLSALLFIDKYCDTKLRTSDEFAELLDSIVDDGIESPFERCRRRRRRRQRYAAERRRTPLYTRVD